MSTTHENVRHYGACVCGWRGRVRVERADALEDAVLHVAKVAAFYGGPPPVEFHAAETLDTTRRLRSKASDGKSSGWWKR